MPRISSTSCISGTGFMKCMPMNRPGRSVIEASRVIEIEEVFEQTMASGFRIGQSSLRMSFLSSSSSVTDSTTTSQSLKASRLVPVEIRASAAVLSASVIFSRATWRAMWPPMVFSAAPRRSSSWSESLTS
jgi:hypothetical protein